MTPQDGATPAMMRTYKVRLKPKPGSGKTSSTFIRNAIDYGYRRRDAGGGISDTPFRTGDLVRIFKTVTDGDVYWRGKVSLERGTEENGRQRSVPRAKWENMFKAGMTCKVERPGGRVLYGALDAWAVNSQRDAYIWILREFGKSAQADGIYTLTDNDRMTVYSTVRDGAVEWEGRLNFNAVSMGRIGAVDVVRTAKHMNARMWLQLCHEKRPALVVPKA